MKGDKRGEGEGRDEYELFYHHPTAVKISPCIR